MSTLQQGLRAAAVTLLRDYAASIPNLDLSVYPGRPKTLRPPHAFVDAMSERIDYTASLALRSPVATLIVVWGYFDSQDAAAQRDRFVDGFLDWWKANKDAAGANTVSGVTGFDDLPAYTPDWIETKTAYYATQVTVEGFGE